MPTAIYKFTDDHTSPMSVIRSKRPSTAAVEALERWCAQRMGRQYETVDESDDHLTFRVTIADDDLDAGEHLQILGMERGLKYELVPAK